MNAKDRISIFVCIMVFMIFIGFIDGRIERQNEAIIENQTTIIENQKTMMVKINAIYRDIDPPFELLNEKIKGE